MLKKPMQDVGFRHLLSMLPAINMETGPWITGGCARRLWEQKDWHMGDVDVFFRNTEQREAWLAEFDKTWNYTYTQRTQNYNTLAFSFDFNEQLTHKPALLPPQATNRMRTDNAITFDLEYRHLDGESHAQCQLQVILAREAPTLQELWKEFDFHVCCFAVDSQFVYADPLAVEDLDSNQITPRSNDSNKNKPLRVFKHFSQGFHVHDDLLKAAIKNICNKEVDWCNNY